MAESRPDVVLVDDTIDGGVTSRTYTYTVADERLNYYVKTTIPPAVQSDSAYSMTMSLDVKIGGQWRAMRPKSWQGGPDNPWPLAFGAVSSMPIGTEVRLVVNLSPAFNLTIDARLTDSALSEVA